MELTYFLFKKEQSNSVVYVSGCMHVQSHPTLCDHMDSSLPGSSLHGILQARTGVGCHFLLQGIFPHPGIKPVSLASPALAGGFFTTSATWKARIDTPITWMTPKGIMLNERSQTQTLHLYDFSQRQSCRNSRQISSFQKLRVGRGCDTRSAGGRSLFEFFRHVPCGILVPHQGLNLQLLSP